MNKSKRIGWKSGLVVCTVTLSVFTCSIYGEQTQTINAKLGEHAGKWHEGSQIDIPCMQTYTPYASLAFDVIVPEPGAVYKVSLSLVKMVNGGSLKVLVDDELQTEVDTLAPTDTRETILVCDRFIAPGKHTIKIKNAGQKKRTTGGNHLSVIGFEVVSPSGGGRWQIDEKVFAFTPLKKKDTNRHANLLLTDLPPRQQEEPFSVLPGDDADGIFSHSLVLVDRILFRIPDINDVPETGLLLEEQRPLAIDLPKSAREIFLLIWSRIPPFDADGGPSKPPIAPINQSERFTAEILYEDGTSDHLIPFNVTTKRYGLDDGLSLYVLHPAADRAPHRLIVHDRVFKCSFAVVALTCNRGEIISPETGPGDISPWYKTSDKRFPAVNRKIESIVGQNNALVSDGSIVAEVCLDNGLQWRRISSPVFGEVTVEQSPVFAIKHSDEWIGSEEWNVVGKETSDKAISIQLAYRDGDIDLRASVKLSLAGNGKIKAGLTLANHGAQPFLGRVRFPILEGIKLGSLADTWYFFPKYGAAIIHHAEESVYGSHGSRHPLQVDSFFNPEQWYALTLLGNDLDGQFHWYDVGKSEAGGWYRLEYLETSLKPGATWRFPECIIAISPGDWRESFRLYREWVSTWYKPKPQVQEWYRESFVTGIWYVYAGLDRLVAGTKRFRDLFGYCDVMALYGWHGREHPENPSHQSNDSGDYRHEYSGEYDRDALWVVGGEENFKAVISQASQAGIPISPYTNGMLINENAYYFGAKRHEFSVASFFKWDQGYRPVDAEMMGYVPCLSNKEWVDYMVDSQRFLAQDLGIKVIYLDQFGYGASLCTRKDHSHEAPLPNFYGEREMTRGIRAAIPEDAVICGETQPEDTRLQFQNAYYQGGILRYFLGEMQGVPMNMTRFAFPDTKCFNNIYHYVLADNNWEYLKFILFNGDAYVMSRAYDPESWYLPAKESIPVLRKMLRILHENVDAFTSSDVEPLIPTLLPGTFVNRYRSDEKVIWTVFNSNFRTVKGRLLKIAGKPGARYVDLWNDAPITTRSEGDTASLVVEIGPRDVACILEIAE